MRSREDTPEEVRKSVTGVEVQVNGCFANNEWDVNSSIVAPTPAHVSYKVFSDRGEEPRTALFYPEQRPQPITPNEEFSDRFGDYSGRRDEEVRRIQEMADLEPRRTRSRGSQDVTAGKSEVGLAIRGPRDSGRVRPSVSPTTSPVAYIALMTL